VIKVVPSQQKKFGGTLFYSMCIYSVL